MNIDFMRRIDYWGGIPLCFSLTVINNIRKLFFTKKTEQTKPKKILFIKPSEMGGIILSYPLIDRVKHAYPDSELFFLTFKRNECLFDVLTIIPAKNIFTLRDESLFTFLTDFVKILIRIHNEKIDISFDLEFFSRFTAILSYLSNAPKRIGFYRYKMEGLYRGELLTHKIQYNPHLHISNMFYSMGEIMSLSQKITPEFKQVSSDHKLTLPQFIPTAKHKEKMLCHLAKFSIDTTSRIFLINPGDGQIPLREWPVDNYIILTRKLLEQENTYVITVGTSTCSGKAKLIEQALKSKRYIDLSGKTSIPELLTLCTIADALIANDSGIAHLASLTNIREFIIFGPENPIIFRPLGMNIHVFYSSIPCSPCLSAFNHRTSTCQDNQCLKIIHPHDIYTAISEKISLMGTKS